MQKLTVEQLQTLLQQELSKMFQNANIEIEINTDIKKRNCCFDQNIIPQIIAALQQFSKLNLQKIKVSLSYNPKFYSATTYDSIYSITLYYFSNYTIGAIFYLAEKLATKHYDYVSYVKELIKIIENLNINLCSFFPSSKQIRFSKTAVNDWLVEFSLDYLVKNFDYIKHTINQFYNLAYSHFEDYDLITIIEESESIYEYKFEIKIEKKKNPKLEVLIRFTEKLSRTGRTNKEYIDVYFSLPAYISHGFSVINLYADKNQIISEMDNFLKKDNKLYQYAILLEIAQQIAEKFKIVLRTRKIKKPKKHRLTKENPSFTDILNEEFRKLLEKNSFNNKFVLYLAKLVENCSTLQFQDENH